MGLKVKNKKKRKPLESSQNGATKKVAIFFFKAKTKKTCFHRLEF